MVYSVAILTVSDTAASQPQTDRSGPILVDAFGSHASGDLAVKHTAIVADDEELIRQTVQQWIDHDTVHLVVTTGGTGFGLRDRTPEALAPLISRPTPALTHAITAHSLQKTPLAALSRSVTGIRRSSNQATDHESLIVVLPGSPKAVMECLEVLLGCQEQGKERQGVLLHALELLSGHSGQKQHQQMQGAMSRDATASIAVSTGTDTGHARSHHHHHHLHRHGHHHGHDHGHDHVRSKGLHSHSMPVPRTKPEDHLGPFPFKTQDPSSGPSLRHRQSPYPILPLDEALRLIADNTPHPADLSGARTATRAVSVELIGSVLAEDITAPRDLPPGPTTNVDGYAVRAASTPAGDYRVVTLRTLTARDDGALLPGEIFRINTGQGLPAGTDAVVMVEDTELLDVYPDDDEAMKGEEKLVRVLAQVESGENVRQKASDVKQGEVVLRKGTTLSALGGEIGTLAFLGRSEVRVFAKPRVAILSTGNELADVGQVPLDAGKAGAQQESWGFTVFDANRPGLKAAVTGMGFECVDLGIVGDDVGETLSALRRGLESADVVITTGGTSMGESDLLKPLIERHLGGQIHFGRVAMKPGKPTTFATIPPVPTPNDETTRGQGVSKQIFALPGNPASALVCFYVFVVPSLRKLCGYPPSPSSSVPSSSSSVAGNKEEVANGWNLPRIQVKTTSEMKLDPRPEFHRCTVSVRADGEVLASSTGSQRSSPAPAPIYPSA
ncbi:uncharacterized protein PFL1_06752 [Pseudozyma flocculosa PF-1]|uniref:MoaB/Mog domain-containing protein n=1 Tax=Pseudozyma flocculosa PF-1 TaxID=1277687 RepID=A0A061H1L9_9BASI|nr:uncharacterized protein PFL1_06752 [Pseudozyma flocculosa PF-1]EPQ25680.1 hypothetical protein PFL1_06752 [Pseudozyma flocculosa PF-1]